MLSKLETAHAVVDAYKCDQGHIFIEEIVKSKKMLVYQNPSPIYKGSLNFELLKKGANETR